MQVQLADPLARGSSELIVLACSHLVVLHLFPQVGKRVEEARNQTSRGMKLSELGDNGCDAAGECGQMGAG